METYMFGLVQAIFNTLNLITLKKSFNSILVFILTSLLKVLIYDVEYYKVTIVSVTVIHKLHHIQCNILLNIQFMSYNTLSLQCTPSSTLLYYLTNTVLSCALIQPCILIQGPKIKIFKKYKNKCIWTNC